MDRRLAALPIAFLALLALLVGSSCSGYLKPPEPQRGLAMTEKMQYFSASNGFRVFVLPDERAPVVRLELRYAVGAMHDPPGKEGMAHLVEHLMFQTRVLAPTGQTSVSAELSRLAQSWNASTSLDSTHYFSQALPEHLPALFALEMNRLDAGCRTWDEETFLREREVVRNEMRQRLYASADGAISTLLYEAAYPSGHPYRHHPGGSDESVSRIQLADVCAFVDRHYRPSNISIFAVGATDEPAVRALATRWLTRFRASPVAPTPPVPAIATGKQRVVTYDVDIDQPQIFALFPLPPTGSLDWRIAEMVQEPDAMLEVLARTYKWGYGAATSIIGGARAPLLAVSVTVHRLGDVDEAIDALWKSVRRARLDSGREKSEISWLTQREYQKERVLARFEPIERRAWEVADYVQFGTPGFLVERLRELDRIGPKDLQRVAASVLDPDKATVVVFRPRPGGHPLPSGTFRYQPTAHDSGAWKSVVDLAEADRPVSLPAQRRRFPPVQRTSLDNGLRVLMWPHGHLPLVHGVLVISTGYGDESAGRVGIAMVAGADGRVTQDTTTFVARDLATEMHTTLARLSRWIRVHRTNDFDEWKELVVGQLERPRAAERARYDRAVRAATFGARHPYARSMADRTEIAGISGGEVARFQRTHYTAGNATLILTGQFDPALAREHVIYQFGHVDDRRRQRTPVPAASPPPGPRLVAGAGDPASAVVEIDLRTAGGHGLRGGQAARRVLAAILDAQLKELREHQAVTYGMSAEYRFRRGPGEWLLWGAADAARAHTALAFALDRLDRMRRDARSYRGEFVLARRALVEELLIGSSNAAEAAGNLALMAEYDLEDDFFDRLIEEAARVTPEEVHRLLLDEIDPARLTIGAFGPPAAVERVLAAARAWRQKTK